LFKDVDPKVNFPQMEEHVLSFWQDRSIFQKSIDNREGAEDYVFYDGPPFATGLPHFGHFVPGTIKDIFPRYQTMKGKRVERRFGWDTHGLPVEYEMEKTLGISGKYEIEQYGVAKFNEECRSIVLRYTSEWETIVTRLGRWVDFDNDYKTMDPSFMESIWWVFKTLWEKKYVYQGYYILPVSPKLGTPLSNFEVNLGGYKDVTDPAITVKFRLKDNTDTAFLAWTTTPWTLPSNLALGLGADIDYVKIQDGEEKYILAAERLDHYYKSEEDYQILERYKGKDLAGISYEPLLPYFADAAQEGAFKTFLGDFVTTEDGTGIVHLAPGFGEDDYKTLKGSGIPTVCPIDDECKFTDEIPEYQGQFVKDADKAIIARLKEEGKLVRRENYLHPYPHCYRTGAPLIYKAVTSWFVDIGKIKDRMLGANAKINWTPDHLKNGRFGKWLEGARDWAISRNRFWGNPIPVWQCDKTGEMVCVGSIDELEKLSGVRPDDLHKHFVDEITWPSPGGGTFRRVPEVLDCWFESGAMPYAQVHYPFENKEWFEKNFPANFISEGLDQTRGWFYTLTILAAALFDKPAFQNVVVNGLVLAEDGKKMSKSLRNYSDPMGVINEFGADALRLFMMMSSVVKAEDLKYSDAGVRDVLKGILIPLWNSYYFFITYAKLDGVRPTNAPENPQNPLDAWIISETETLIHRVTEELDQYDIQRAITPILEFIDGLNNWYIRRSRRRFWKSENDGDKNEAYQTLYYVLKTLAKVMAPITPFIAEEFYQNLKNDEEPESVHLCDYPSAREERRDEALERKMELTQQAVSMGRRLRVMHNLKTRQPLKALHLVTKDPEERNILLEMQDIIMEELNVKEVVFRENEEELVEYQAKANFKVLGRQLGKDMKAAAARIEKLTGGEIAGLLDGATLVIEVGQRSVELTAESLDIRRFEKENLKILNEKSLTIALDPQLNPELIQEGIVRDLTRGIQNLRKERGLEVSDRIKVYVHGGDLIKESINNFGDYLTGETLGNEILFEKAGDAVEVEAGEEKAFVSFVKV
jgi:isoleucyl-tRNA synthetase